MEISKISDILIESRQFKMLLGFFITTVTFLFGEIEAPMIALWLLIVIDTMTKWMSISKRTMEAENSKASLWYGFYLALKKGNINSLEMRRKFATKIIAYVTLIIAANLTGKVVPSIVLFGNDISKFPGGFVNSFLAVTELLSIIENLVEMGMDVLKPLAVLVNRKRDEMTGLDEDREEN